MAEVFKRPALPLVPVNEAKRPRESENAIILSQNQFQNEIPRSSGLQAPNMLLTGHEGEIYSTCFSSDGTFLASVGFDMKIFLWNVYGDCENFSTLTGHTGSIMDVHFNSDSSHLYTCSTDKSVRIWDMETGVCIRKFKAHIDFVNSCHPARRGPELICSGSDDGTVVIHDSRKREPAFRAENLNQYQVTAISFGDMPEYMISGGIDNVLKIWDIRRSEVVYFLPGHSDTITGLSLNSQGSHILSNSMDCTELIDFGLERSNRVHFPSGNNIINIALLLVNLKILARIWDIRPFATQQRCTKVFTGHQHNFEKNLLKCAWTADGKHVTCGSSDRFNYVWNVDSTQIIYKLPGHQGSINGVDFHPTEPILLSGGSDKRIYLGELQF